jgi:hypothetical protein
MNLNFIISLSIISHVLCYCGYFFPFNFLKRKTNTYQNVSTTITTMQCKPNFDFYRKKNNGKNVSTCVKYHKFIMNALPLSQHNNGRHFIARKTAISRLRLSSMGHNLYATFLLLHLFLTTVD